MQKLWSALFTLLLNFAGTYVFPSVQLWAFPNTVISVHISLVENGNERVNSCVNFSPPLVVWKKELENPNFGNSFIFALEYARLCEICSVKWLAKGERQSRGKKKRREVKVKPYKKKFTWTWESDLFHQRRKKKMSALYGEIACPDCLWCMSISEIHRTYLQISASSSDPMATVMGISLPLPSTCYQFP